MKGCVFDIQRFSVHDGPGIRTTIFLKGCPLHCKWCCNPESMNPHPEVLFNPKLCIGCGTCVQVCPNHAVTVNGFDRSLCTGCGICAEKCYAQARYMKGQYMTPEEVFAEGIKDKSFYKRTNGGVTFSGGEPTLQVDFLEATLKQFKTAGIGTAIETCGYSPWENYQRIAPYVDVFLFDIKHTDSDKHLEYTGGRCERIMENCRRLAGIAANLIIRVPVIPYFNFDEEALTSIVRFAEKIGVKEVDFLPFHRMAANKYTFLGRDYWNPGIDRLEESAVEEYVKNIHTTIKLQIGG